MILCVPLWLAPRLRHADVADVTANPALADLTYGFYATVTSGGVESQCSTGVTGTVAYLLDTTAPTWANSLSNSATYASIVSSPSVTFVANASDGSGSGVQKYQISIGTTSGGTQTLGWTDLAGTTAPTSPVQQTGLSLTGGATYYFNMRAVDNLAWTSIVNTSSWMAYTVPTLSYVGATGRTGTFGSLMSVSPTTLATNGSAITGCAIKAATTALPAWATLNITTCVISGTPNATLVATTYTINATNSAGNSADATVQLTVNAAVPTLSYAAATGTSGTFRRAHDRDAHDTRDKWRGDYRMRDQSRYDGTAGLGDAQHHYLRDQWYPGRDSRCYDLHGSRDQLRWQQCRCNGAAHRRRCGSDFELLGCCRYDGRVWRGDERGAYDSRDEWRGYHGMCN